MARSPYDLPSMTTLAAFEAAARLTSMKSAAAELNVTPGAVSRQVKTLETDLGVRLFTRLHRGVELTPEGQELADILAQGFSRAADFCRHLRHHTEGPSLTIGATTAFASLWLIPRIGGFWQQCPAVTVNHVISEDPPDLRRGMVDFAFRYGQGDWSGIDSVELFGDRLMPVCGGDLAQSISHQHGVDCADLPAECLTELPLLRLQGVDPSWVDWAAWFQWAGIRWSPAPGSGRSLNNYTVAVQAACDNQGVALGWERLVAPMIDRGDLVRLTGLAMPAPGAHHLTWLAGRVFSPAMTDFRDWITTGAPQVI